MFKSVLILVATLFFISGCGGATAPQSLPLSPSQSQMKTINISNSKGTAFSSFKSIFGNGINPTNGFSARVVDGKKIAKPSFRVALNVAKLLKVSSKQCENGSGSVDVNEIVPNQKYDVTFHNCSFTQQDYYGNNQYYTYNGNIKLESLGNDQYKEEFDHLSIKTDNSQQFNITKATAIINANTSETSFTHMYAKFSAPSIKTEYLNMNITVKVLSDSSIDYTVAGYVKSCNGGYVYFKTNPKVHFDNYDETNNSGDITISSKGKQLTVTFTTDGVYLLDVDGYTTTYTYDEYFDLIEGTTCN